MADDPEAARHESEGPRAQRWFSSVVHTDISPDAAAALAGLGKASAAPLAKAAVLRPDIFRKSRRVESLKIDLRRINQKSITDGLAKVFHEPKSVNLRSPVFVRRTPCCCRNAWDRPVDAAFGGLP